MLTLFNLQAIAHTLELTSNGGQRKSPSMPALTLNWRALESRLGGLGLGLFECYQSCADDGCPFPITKRENRMETDAKWLWAISVFNGGNFNCIGHIQSAQSLSWSKWVDKPRRPFRGFPGGCRSFDRDFIQVSFDRFPFGKQANICCICKLNFLSGKCFIFLSPASFITI